MVADKTGTGDYATANDAGIAWTTKGAPLVLAVLSTNVAVNAPVDNALIADAAPVLASPFARTGDHARALPAWESLTLCRSLI